MNNYEYIIAGFPDISRTWHYADGQSFDSLVEEVRSQCSDKDKVLIDLLLKGFDENSLTPELYTDALASKDRFIRNWFAYDLAMRNSKVRWLNKELGRPADQDVVAIEAGIDPEEQAQIDAVLSGKDLLEREHGLDDLLWAKADEITTFDTFDIQAILCLIAKLHIVSRWLELDEAEGRKMFHRLVQEVRGTYKGTGNQTD